MIRRKTKISLFISVCAACCLNAAAQESLLEHHDMTRDFATGMYRNPAMQHGRYATTFNELTVSYSGRQSTAAANPEDGTAHNLAIGNIDAYVVKGNASIWGTAYYANGEQKNQLYSETTDWQLLYPYLMADTVGGNTKEEVYHFLGGFAQKFGKWHLGGEGEYNATLAYRNVDPRPRNLTSDLRITLGATYDAAIGALGIAATGRRYKQTNELKLYNEVNKPMIYHLVGLGQDYYRFRGDNTNTYYEGWGGGGQLTFANKQGMNASLAYDYMHLKKVISDLNQLPMAYIRQHEEQAQVAYIKRNAKCNWAVRLDQTYSVRKGEENIFGSAVNNIYPVISSAEQYRMEQFSLNATAMYQQQREKKRYGALLTTGYESRKETYAEPAQWMKTAGWNTKLNLNADMVHGKWSFTGNVTAAYTVALSGNELLMAATQQGDGSTTAFSVPTLARFAYYDSNRMTTALAADAAYSPTKKYAIFARLQWQYERYMHGEHQNTELLTLGVRF